MCMSAFGPFSCHLLPVVDKIFFRCFGISFCVYCFTLWRNLINLPSFVSTFWFISSSCIVFFFLCSFFVFVPAYSSVFPFFIILALYHSLIRAFHISVSRWLFTEVLLLLLLSSNSFDFFFTPKLADGFTLECEWQQVSSSLQTLLSILIDLNNAVVWVVSICSLISKSSNPCNNLLVILSSTPITTDTAVTFMSHSLFFSSPTKSWYLSLISISFCLTQWSTGTSKSGSTGSFFFLFLFASTTSGRLAEIRLSVCISKYQRILCV